MGRASKGEMPTPAEAGPLGAQKSRAVLREFRAVVKSELSARKAREAREANEVFGRNAAAADAHDARVAEVSATIGALERSVEEATASAIRAALEKQLQAKRSELARLESEPPAFEEIPVETRRVDKNARQEKFRRVRDTAQRRATIAREIAGLLRSGSASGIEMDARPLTPERARLFEQIFVSKDGEEGSFDDLVYRQYLKDPRLLPPRIRERIQTILTKAMDAAIDSSLPPNARELPADTLNEVRVDLRTEYDTPKALRALLADASARPENSMFADVSGSPVADAWLVERLFEEASLRGATPEQMAAFALCTQGRLARLAPHSSSNINVGAASRGFVRLAGRLGAGDRGEILREIAGAVRGRELNREEAESRDGAAFLRRVDEFAVTADREATKAVEIATKRADIRLQFEAAEKTIEKLRADEAVELERQFTVAKEKAADDLARGMKAIGDSERAMESLEGRATDLANNVRAYREDLTNLDSAGFLRDKMAQRAKHLLEDASTGVLVPEFKDAFFRFIMEMRKQRIDQPSALAAEFLRDPASNVRPAYGQWIPVSLLRLQDGFEYKSKSSWAPFDSSRIIARTNDDIRRVVTGLPSPSDVGIFASADRDALVAARGTLSEDVRPPTRDTYSTAAFESQLYRDAEPLKAGLQKLFDRKLELIQSVYNSITSLEYAINRWRETTYEREARTLRETVDTMNRRSGELDGEIREIDSRIDNLEGSWYSPLSVVGLGKADRKRLASLKQEREENRRQSREAVETLNALQAEVIVPMNNVHSENLRIQDELRPPEKTNRW